MPGMTKDRKADGPSRGGQAPFCCAKTSQSPCQSPNVPIACRLRRVALSLLSVCFAAAIAGVPPAWADRFELKTGGQIVGREIERTDSGGYVVEGDSGVRITIDRSQLQRIVRFDDKEQAYLQQSRQMEDTAEAHRAMAEWCREKGLRTEADVHLQRLIELEPDDEAARLSLGYQRVGDRWMTRDDIMRSRGMDYFDGTYRTPQDIAIRQGIASREEVEVEWLRKLKLWRGWLGGRRADRSAEAAANIRALTDPLAAPPLLKLLEREDDPEVRNLLIATLAQLEHPQAIEKLINLSIDDPDEEVRFDCLGYLKDDGRPIPLEPYVKALKSKDNEIVNRAGAALHEIGNPKAISPLIDALVTTHKYLISDQPAEQMNVGMSSRGGGGLSLGGGKKYISHDHENYAVQRALIELSGGQNFGFDKEVWRRWFVNYRMREQLASRRDK